MGIVSNAPFPRCSASTILDVSSPLRLTDASDFKWRTSASVVASLMRQVQSGGADPRDAEEAAAAQTGTVGSFILIRYLPVRNVISVPPVHWALYRFSSSRWRSLVLFLDDRRLDYGNSIA